MTLSAEGERVSLYACMYVSLFINRTAKYNKEIKFNGKTSSGN